MKSILIAMLITVAGMCYGQTNECRLSVFELSAIQSEGAPSKSPFEAYASKLQQEDAKEVKERRKGIRWGWLLTGIAFTSVGVWDAMDNNVQSYICSTPWVLCGGFMIATSF